MEGTLPSQSDSAKVDDYAEIAKIVRHHHERVDGQDIQTAVGEEIPLLSRIISVADATTR
jgi:HD-GYP domain-containing protein (c-di-GMP phosphodiesterase class II)